MAAQEDLDGGLPVGVFDPELARVVLRRATSREPSTGTCRARASPRSCSSNPVLREDAIRTTVQLVVGERCALAASSGLINAAPDEASKRFLATQTLDEARHVEIFTQRLYDLGVRKSELEDDDQASTPTRTW